MANNYGITQETSPAFREQNNNNLNLYIDVFLLIKRIKEQKNHKEIKKSYLKVIQLLKENTGIDLLNLNEEELNDLNNKKLEEQQIEIGELISQLYDKLIENGFIYNIKELEKDLTVSELIKMFENNNIKIDKKSFNFAILKKELFSIINTINFKEVNFYKSFFKSIVELIKETKGRNELNVNSPHYKKLKELEKNGVVKFKEKLTTKSILNMYNILKKDFNLTKKNIEEANKDIFKFNKDLSYNKKLISFRKTIESFNLIEYNLQNIQTPTNQYSNSNINKKNKMEKEDWSKINSIQQSIDFLINFKDLDINLTYLDNNSLNNIFQDLNKFYKLNLTIDEYQKSIDINNKNKNYFIEYFRKELLKKENIILDYKMIIDKFQKIPIFKNIFENPKDNNSEIRNIIYIELNSDEERLQTKLQDLFDNGVFEGYQFDGNNVKRISGKTSISAKISKTPDEQYGLVIYGNTFGPLIKNLFNIESSRNSVFYTDLDKSFDLTKISTISDKTLPKEMKQFRDEGYQNFIFDISSYMELTQGIPKDVESLYKNIYNELFTDVLFFNKQYIKNHPYSNEYNENYKRIFDNFDDKLFLIHNINMFFEIKLIKRVDKKEKLNNINTFFEMDQKLKKIDKELLSSFQYIKYLFLLNESIKNSTTDIKEYQNIINYFQEVIKTNKISVIELKKELNKIFTDKGVNYNRLRNLKFDDILTNMFNSQNNEILNLTKDEYLEQKDFYKLTDIEKTTKLLTLLNEQMNIYDQNIELDLEKKNHLQILTIVNLFKIIKNSSNELLEKIDLNQFDNIIPYNIDIKKLKELIDLNIDLNEINVVEISKSLNEITKDYQSIIENNKIDIIMNFIEEINIENNKKIISKINGKIVKNVSKLEEDIINKSEDQTLKNFTLFKRQLNILQNKELLSEKSIKYINRYGEFNFFLNFNSFDQLKLFKEDIKEDKIEIKEFQELLKEINNMENILNMKKSKLFLKLLKDKSTKINKLLFLITVINDKLNDNDVNIKYYDFEDKNMNEEFIIEVDNILKAIENLKENEKENLKKQFNKFSENDIITTNIPKLHLPYNLSKIISEIMILNNEDTTSLKEIKDIEIINNLYLPFKLNKNISNQLTYSMIGDKNLTKIENEVLKTRTRYSQLSYLTLKLSYELINNKNEEELKKEFVKYFENENKYNEFIEILKKEKIFSKDKDEVYIIRDEDKDGDKKQKNKDHKHFSLNEYLKKNNHNIETYIETYQGYIPGDYFNKTERKNVNPIGKFIFEELKKISSIEILENTGLIKSKVLKDGKKEYNLSYLDVLTTPFISQPFGLVTGNTIRNLNPNKENKKNIMYTFQKQIPKILDFINNENNEHLLIKINTILKEKISKQINLKDDFYTVLKKKLNYKDFNTLKEVLNDIYNIIEIDIKDKIKDIENIKNNVIDEEKIESYKILKNELIVSSYEQPKEIASSLKPPEKKDVKNKIFTQLDNDFKEILKLITLPSHFIKGIESLDEKLKLTENKDDLIINITEGMKDGTSLINLQYKTNNKKEIPITIPLQGTHSLSEELIFDVVSELKNRYNKDIKYIKNYADYDGAGIGLLLTLKNILKETNIEEIAMIDEMFNKTKLPLKSDLTDFIDDSLKNKISYKMITKKLNNFNNEFNIESEVVKDIIRIEIKELVQDELKKIDEKYKNLSNEDIVKKIEDIVEKKLKQYNLTMFDDSENKQKSYTIFDKNGKEVKIKDMIKFISDKTFEKREKKIRIDNN